ncbi:MAG TPA: hypothetical protein DEB39_05285 [Planctomycetaceae bacterium]|nr:hypothetical protein [Planctomycetaceae bacterium]
MSGGPVFLEKYTGNAVKTDIRSSLPAALTRLERLLAKCLNGSFGRRAIVRGRIVVPFAVSTDGLAQNPTADGA